MVHNGASMLPLRGFSAKINKKSLPIVLLRVIFREENPKQWSIDSVGHSFNKLIFQDGLIIYY